MLFYRKNVGGVWHTKKISFEEAKKIQEKILKIGLVMYKNVKEISEKAGLALPDAVAAAIVEKSMPSYDSLANDIIEEELSK
jgi:hypothetical protein